MAKDTNSRGINIFQCTKIIKCINHTLRGIVNEIFVFALPSVIAERHFTGGSTIGCCIDYNIPASCQLLRKAAFLAEMSTTSMGHNNCR